MWNRLEGVFKSFEKHKVKYLVIGGIATVLHGVPRATFDLDILIQPTSDNADRLLAALMDAGIGAAGETTPSEILDYEITVFEDIVRIDVQTQTPGINFDEAWQRKDRINYHDQEILVVCKEDLIQAKLASGREIDLKDVDQLKSTKDVE